MKQSANATFYSRIWHHIPEFLDSKNITITKRIVELEISYMFKLTMGFYDQPQHRSRENSFEHVDISQKGHRAISEATTD